MNFFFFLYLSLVLWFFIWVRPRVNDGTIAIIYDNLRGLVVERVSLWRTGYNFRKWQIKKYTKRLPK
jgi:hypothetical protein